jgi:hypothetical protein
MRTWVPLLLLLVVAGPFACFFTACCFPRWGYNQPGTINQFWCKDWLELPDDGANRIPFLPERFQASSHYRRHLALVDPGSGADIYHSSTYISPGELTGKRLYCVDMSWQYKGRSFLAPMLLERITVAEYFPLRITGVMPRDAAVPPPLLHPADLPLIAKAFDEFWTLHPDTAPPANVRREFTLRPSPNVTSLGREIYWPGVALNILFVTPPLLTLYVFINAVRASIRSIDERSRKGRVGRDLCPKCLYHTAGLPADELGFIVCPECGERVVGEQEPIPRTHAPDEI